jgi:hypothetical protein
MAGTTVGVLLTPRTDGHRLWDTTAVRVQGDLDLEPQDRASIERLFGQRGDSVVLTDADGPLDELRRHHRAPQGER